MAEREFQLAACVPCRALECDEYSNVTATFYLLAERKLKKQHSDSVKPANSGRGRAASSSRPPRLEHSLSSPNGTYGSCERYMLVSLLSPAT